MRLQHGYDRNPPLNTPGHRNWGLDGGPREAVPIPSVGWGDSVAVVTDTSTDRSILTIMTRGLGLHCDYGHGGWEDGWMVRVRARSIRSNRSLDKCRKGRNLESDPGSPSFKYSKMDLGSSLDCRAAIDTVIIMVRNLDQPQLTLPWTSQSEMCVKTAYCA